MASTITTPPTFAPQATVPMAVSFARQVVAQVDHVSGTPNLSFQRDHESARSVDFFVDHMRADPERIAAFRAVLAYSVGAPARQSHIYADGKVLMDGVSEFGVRFSVIVPADLISEVLA